MWMFGQGVGMVAMGLICWLGFRLVRWLGLMSLGSDVFHKDGCLEVLLDVGRVGSWLELSIGGCVWI